MRRKTLGLEFYYDNESNSGIVNYLFSLIKALNTLPKDKKPNLIIFYSGKSPIEMIKAENYPFIKFSEKGNYERVPIDLFSRIVNKLSFAFTGKLLLYDKRPFVDYLFPFSLDAVEGGKTETVQWLVDFNPYYFPDHLTSDQRQAFFDFVKKVVYSKNKVVLSSYDIFNDLKKFHPNYTCKVEILRFASLLPKYDHVNIAVVKPKFHITKPYVMTPNQFWVHKNHIVLFKAAKLLREKGIEFQMIFTGSTKVESGSNYYQTLLDFIKENGLENEIKILGIVDRAEQLTLMKHSEALVQPSLFEGWSTLVEESKALNKHIVVSDLAIHREQIDLNCTFFNPEDEIQLEAILEKIFTEGISVQPYDYNQDIKKYAERIIEIFS